MKKYKSGEIVTGCVTGIEKYGVFVSLDEYVKIGETIKAKVIDENEDEHHVKLSIKNIDYRITKRKSTKIVETPHGFSTLQSQLSKWVTTKIQELEASKVKK